MARIIWYLASMTWRVAGNFFSTTVYASRRTVFSALDGTGVLLRERDDPSLPAALPSGSQLRETVYGVADSTTLEVIAGRCAAIVR